MPDRIEWGDGPGMGYFVGDWTLEEVVAFAQRVAEIAVEERERAAGDE